jgi:signal-transduction protein with cAMP-binding, CBS, and nucleotidyltransferase domain
MVFGKFWCLEKIFFINHFNLFQNKLNHFQHTQMKFFFPVRYILGNSNLKNIVKENLHAFLSQKKYSITELKTTIQTINQTLISQFHPFLSKIFYY